MARQAILENRSISKRQATLDHILMREWDKEYLQYYEKFSEIRRHPTESFEYYAKNPNLEKVKFIKRILNDYEMIAVGIKNNILDEDIYKSWERYALLANFKAAKPYIDIRQKASPKAYVEFCDLAKSWNDDGGEKVLDTL